MLFAYVTSCPQWSPMPFLAFLLKSLLSPLGLKLKIICHRQTPSPACTLPGIRAFAYLPVCPFSVVQVTALTTQTVTVYFLPCAFLEKDPDEATVQTA